MSVNPPSTPSKVPENLKFSSNKSVEVADRTSCSPELTVKGRGEERTKKDIRLWHSVQDSIDSMEGILDLGGSDDVIIQPVRMPKRQKMEYNSSSSVSLDEAVHPRSRYAEGDHRAAKLFAKDSSTSVDVQMYRALTQEFQSLETMQNQSIGGPRVPLGYPTVQKFGSIDDVINLLSTERADVVLGDDIYHGSSSGSRSKRIYEEGG
eukprot:GHVH01016578.1.p1 GENE.GHVH01016578.1~~GHVH01016578.1.p1  ORF type:complete len:207 (-),score=34.18 GHVH01016578.1:272-892(-)